MLSIFNAARKKSRTSKAKAKAQGMLNTVKGKMNNFANSSTGRAVGRTALTTVGVAAGTLLASKISGRK